METSKENFDFRDSVELPETPKEHSLIYKIIKTICIVLVWVCIGFWSEINGATLQDLKHRTNSDYEVISRAMSMRGAGGLCGAILGGGYLIDKFHSKVELILSCALLACAALNAAVPYCRQIELLFAIYVGEGWMEVLVNIGGQVIIMDTWKARASGPLHLIHLGYGVGGFIVPQIVANFISDVLPSSEIEITNPECLKVFGTVNASSNATMPTPPSPSDTVEYGFLIVSGIIVGIAIIWLFYFFCDKKVQNDNEVRDRASFREIFNLNTCSPGHPLFAFIIYALMFIWIFVAVAGERIFAKYLYSYARDQACFDKDEAKNILTAYWISFTAGRFGGFIITNFLPMKYFIFIEGIGNLASAMVLFFFATNKYVLWTCVCISGILIGPCYPSGLAWANRYVLVTATGVTVLSVGAGVSDLSFLSTIGYFIDKLGIQVMTSFFLGYGVIVFLLPIAMQSVACTRGDRFERENEDQQETPEID